MKNKLNIEGIDYISTEVVEKEYIKVDSVQDIIKDSYQDIVDDVFKKIRSRLKPDDVKVKSKKVDEQKVKVKSKKVDELKKLSSRSVLDHDDFVGRWVAHAESNKYDSSVKVWMNGLSDMNKALYKNVSIKNGNIYIAKSGQDPFLSVKNREEIKKELSKGIIDIKKWSKKIKKGIPTTKRVFYNIYKGVFDSPRQSEEKRVNHDDKIFRPSKSLEHYYVYEDIFENGRFLYENRSISTYTIWDIIEIRERVIGKEITRGEAKNISKELDIDFTKFQKIVYSLEQGAYDAWIEEWNERYGSTTP